MSPVDPIRILAVEDDQRIRAAMKMTLESEGFLVDEAGTGEEALVSFRSSPVSMVLIDIMLPGADGFEVCKSIRAMSDVPIIMVTARDNATDIVAGLEAGADDYLTKPFEHDVLHARIKALLRRTGSVLDKGAHYLVGDLDIRPDEGRVFRAGTEIHLTRTEFRLLCELAAHPDKVFSRESLLDRVWGYGYFGDGRLVDVHIRRLRTKIERDPGNPRYVVTVRGLGYRLDA